MLTTLPRALISIAAMLAVLIFIGFLWIIYLGLGEDICFDRHPWWGPPEDPTSTWRRSLLRVETSRPVPEALARQQGVESWMTFGQVSPG
jgi:hypothetical protein